MVLVLINIKSIVNYIEGYRLKLELKKLYLDKQKALKDFLKTNKHEWIVMIVHGKKRYVCKHTGFCPEVDGFIPMFDVKYQLHMIKVEDSVQENINNKLTELMGKYNLKFFEIREIADVVLKTQNDTIKELLPE